MKQRGWMWIDDSEFEGTLKHFPLRRDKHGARRSERPRGPPTHQQPSVRTKHLLRVPFLWAPLRVCTDPWPLICSAIILKAGEETVSVRNKEALTVNHSTARDGRAALQRLRGDRVAAFFIKRSVVVNQPSLSFRGKSTWALSVCLFYHNSWQRQQNISSSYLEAESCRLDEAFIRAVLFSSYLPLLARPGVSEVSGIHIQVWEISFSLRQRNVFNVFNL